MLRTPISRIFGKSIFFIKNHDFFDQKINVPKVISDLYYLLKSLNKCFSYSQLNWGIYGARSNLFDDFISPFFLKVSISALWPFWVRTLLWVGQDYVKKQQHMYVWVSPKLLGQL